MSEYNLFCYSEKYDDDNSFQQKRYRAFNKQLTKERYNEILSIAKNIIPNNANLKLDAFWKSVTVEQWNKLLDIPEAKDFKEGFEFISGIKIETDQIKVTANGKEVWISKESANSLGLI